jgi:hypothetical protein
LLNMKFSMLIEDDIKYPLIFLLKSCIQLVRINQCGSTGTPNLLGAHLICCPVQPHFWGELEREHLRYIIMSQTWSLPLLTFSIGFDRQFLHISIFTQQGLFLNHLFQMPTTGLTRMK